MIRINEYKVRLPYVDARGRRRWVVGPAPGWVEVQVYRKYLVVRWFEDGRFRAALLRGAAGWMVLATLRALRKAGKTVKEKNRYYLRGGDIVEYAKSSAP